MKWLFGWFVAGAALLQAGAVMAAEAPRNCADTFQTPEFQALDFREPYKGTHLLNLIESLNGQTCTVDQLEAFFNARHAVTDDRYPDRIFFRATLKTSGFLFKKMINIGASIKGGEDRLRFRHGGKPVIGV